MSHRFSLAGLSSILIIFALDLAQADQFFPSTSQTGSFHSCQVGTYGVRCTHFEGYIVVRRHEAVVPAAHSDPVLSANRFYLPAGDEKTP